VIQLLFRMFVHPGVYSAVGLPGWKTWQAVNRTPERLAVRYHATRNIVRTLLDTGVFERGHVPRGWRALCGVDRFGEPVGPELSLPLPAASTS
jgi:hypothetical protein